MKLVINKYDSLDRNQRAALIADRKSLQSAEENGSFYSSVSTSDRGSLVVTEEGNLNNVLGVAQWLDELELGRLLYISWAHSDHPKAFLLLALGIRSVVREKSALGVRFTVYADNERMHAMAQSLRAKPSGITYAATF